MARPKRWLVNIGIVTVSLLFAALLGEAVLAVLGVTQKAIVRVVPGKGMTYIPGASYRHTKEGFSEGHFNSHGFRDYERTYEKPDGMFRILVLGDSYVEAFQVPLEKSFPALLEHDLNSGLARKKFEVLALGQSGFGTADEYVRYVNFGVQYAPDVVILAFLTGNDFRDNSETLSQEPLASFFVLDGQGRLVLDNSRYEEYDRRMQSPVRRLIMKLRERSYLLSLVSENWYLFNHRGDQKRAEDELRTATELPVTSTLNIYRPNPPQPWRDTIELTERIILTLRASAEQHGSQFVLVTLTNAEQVHPRIGEPLNQRYGMAFDYDLPDRSLEVFAQQAGITFLKLLPGFREYHLRTGVDLHGFHANGLGHWNEDGHKLAEEMILRFLRDRHLVPTASH